MVIAFYTVLVGADPPVVRAAVLGTLSLAAGQTGSRQTGLNSLAIVAGLMSAFNPTIFWDVGFQLSLRTVQGYNLLRIDRNGWIELTTDGEQMWSEVERKIKIP